jgi:hypothetical protein
VCVCLAALGLGGGLAMAFFGFNSSESSPRIAGVPREIIYVPPPGSRSPESTSAGEAADAAALLQSGGRATGNSLAILQAASPAEHPFGTEKFDLATTEPATNNFDNSAGGLLHAQHPADAGLFAANTAAANEAAFSALSTPVPEPSTWAMMLSGAGVLLARLRGRKRS